MEPFQPRWWVTTELLIEPAGPEDVKPIVDFLKTCHLPGEDIRRSHLIHFYLARRVGELVGVVGLQPYGEYGLLRSLAVLESQRNQGLGRSLVSIIEAHAISNGVAFLYLLTTTADRFFAKLVYQVAKRGTVPEVIKGTAEFKYICPEDALCMQKRIANE
jgi:amino-acid N-acetyltransferase